MTAAGLLCHWALTRLWNSTSGRRSRTTTSSSRSPPAGRSHRHLYRTGRVPAPPDPRDPVGLTLASGTLAAEARGAVRDGVVTGSRGRAPAAGAGAAAGAGPPHRRRDLPGADDRARRGGRRP